MRGFSGRKAPAAASIHRKQVTVFGGRPFYFLIRFFSTAFLLLSHHRHLLKYCFLDYEKFVIIYKEFCENCVKILNEYLLQIMDIWRTMKTTSRDPKHGT